ncbi:MAG TPA: hypothetical protein VK935_21460, partial [Actinomycetospora sp.]|nr:hypothetical protein [Actinomycetospora sp.]
MPDTGSSSAALRLPPIRWAVAGPGRIAAKVAADLALVEGTPLAAVGSRSAERARAFADEHGGPG